METHEQDPHAGQDPHARQDPFAAFDARHNLTFRDPLLLRQAFVHRSYFNEHSLSDASLADNERLEFLGDSVLGFVVSEILYRRYPEAREGTLTHLRTLLVRREALAQMAIDLGMGDLLLLGIGEEESGGRLRLATLCACFEALIGAIFIDQGLEKVREFLSPRVDAVLSGMHVSAMPKDPKSRFQEWAQRTKSHTPRYKVVEQIGPDHAKTFVTVVMVKGELMGVGTGQSKQDASQAAAASALARAGEFAPEHAPNPELETRHNLAPVVASEDGADAEAALAAGVEDALDTGFEPETESVAPDPIPLP
jgi:ribonuclease-3